MKNVQVEVKGNILTLKVDLAKRFGPSKSGKTMLIASTEGNQKVEGDDKISFGFFAYTKEVK